MVQGISEKNPENASSQVIAHVSSSSHVRRYLVMHAFLRSAHNRYSALICGSEQRSAKPFGTNIYTIISSLLTNFQVQGLEGAVDITEKPQIWSIGGGGGSQTGYKKVQPL